MLSSSPNARGAPPTARRRRGGFTVLEVAMAAGVLALGLATTLTTLSYGLRSIDTARNMTLASQIIQSEIEILRLQNWSQIVALQTAQVTAATPTTIDPTTTITSGTSSSLDAQLTNIASKFACTRLIQDISGRSNIKTITLRVTWTGLDERPHALAYQMRYAKNGLSDYFYVAH